MPQRVTKLRPEVREGAAAAPLERAFAAIRRELEVREEFPAEVLKAAEQVASAADLPERDELGVEFVTIDPPGSMDLDQALHIEPAGDGFRIRYAIADVPAFVEPGGPIDHEVRRRGQTIYCPDTRVPLHPTVVSEDAASLLPGLERAAYVWDVRIGPDGRRQEARVYRAMVQSRRRYTYDEVQQLVDAAEAEETLMLLREVGRLRVQRESERGGASLPMPEQEVHVDEEGRYRLQFRPMVPASDWNAQISLLTGITAAEIMLEGGIGILRTMPPPQQRDVDRFRRQVRALGVQWPKGLAYGDFLRGLDWQDPRSLAVIHDATALFRGAGYTAFDGQLPDQPEQAAVAAAYTHVTAPLRRLVDRFSLVVCEALTDGREVPRWAREALPLLPEVMAGSDRQAKGVDRACTDAVEAAVLQHRVGEVFEASVVDENGKSGFTLQVSEPAISAPADGRADLGDRVRARLVQADIAEHRVRFEIVDVREAG